MNIFTLCVDRFIDEGKLNENGPIGELPPSAFVTVTLTVPPDPDTKSSGCGKDRRCSQLRLLANMRFRSATGYRWRERRSTES